MLLFENKVAPSYRPPTLQNSIEYLLFHHGPQVCETSGTCTLDEYRAHSHLPVHVQCSFHKCIPCGVITKQPLQMCVVVILTWVRHTHRAIKTSLACAYWQQLAKSLSIKFAIHYLIEDREMCVIRVSCKLLNFFASPRLLGSKLVAREA